jgi:hypothetical protein
MLRKRHVDPCSHVIILQVAALGDLAYSFKGYDYRNLPSLGEYLSSIYPPDFEVKAYEVSQYPVCEPEIRGLKIEDLSEHGINEISTLYVPQLRNAPIHLSMLDKYDLDILD